MDLSLEAIPKYNHFKKGSFQAHGGISLEKIKAKQIKIAVIGLGYVGLPLSLTFAQEDVAILGFDIDAHKTQMILKGESYMQHLESEKIQGFLDKKLLDATTDFRRVCECEAIVICVPTPLTKHLEPDLRFIQETCQAIAPYIQPHTLIALESTTWPGTTEEIVQPILEEKAGLEVGKDLYLCFSPEREDPGNALYCTKSIPKLVGGINQKSMDLAVELYRLGVSEVIPVKDTKVAESAKLVENIFRSVNIALVNELKMIFDKLGIDVWEVIRAAKTKPFGFMPFWPGPGLGGHCIPIDPFYLTWKAKGVGLSTRFIELAGEINRSMPQWVVLKIADCLNQYEKPLKTSRILILGLAYKPDVGDMRGSPSLELMQLLEERGACVEYNDPFITEIPQNRDYARFIGRKSQGLSSHYDCFVLATHHQSYCKDSILSYGTPIIDTRHFFPSHDLIYRA